MILLMKKRTKKLIPYEPIRDRLLKDPEIKKGYDALEFKYSLISAIMDKRIKDGLTQDEVAKKVGTKQSAIARFESGRHDFNLSFLIKVARELDLKIVVKEA